MPKVTPLLATVEAFGTSSVCLQNPRDLSTIAMVTYKDRKQNTNRQHRHVRSSRPGSVGPKVPALQLPTPVGLDGHLMPVCPTTKALAPGQSPAFKSFREYSVRERKSGKGSRNKNPWGSKITTKINLYNVGFCYGLDLKCPPKVRY